jgi:hypothetical protein
MVKRWVDSPFGAVTVAWGPYMTSKHQPTEPRVAWKFGSYAHAIDKSRQWLYGLPPELQPRSIKVGRNRIIIEPPAEFLNRLAQQYKKFHEAEMA